MPAFNFKAQFAAAVESGQKRQTIRPRRRRSVRVGETLQLYTGQRTAKCRLLREAVCIEVKTVEIYHDEVWIEQQRLSHDELEAFARADGFDSVEEFFRFFRSVYDLSKDNPLTEMQFVKWE